MYARQHGKIAAIALSALLVGGLFLSGAITLLGAPPIVRAQEASDSQAQADENGNTGTPPAAQGGLLRDGIFGCHASKYANIGSLSAVGGIYVPVNDAAVTLNTGYLVYKECVLDGVVSKIRQGATADLLAASLRAMDTGRGGQAQYVKNQADELRARADRIVLVAVDDANVAPMCGAFKNTVRTTVVRSYLQQRNQPNSVFSCTAPTESGSYWDTLAALREPQNNPYGAYLLLQEQISGAIAADEQNIREQWLWGSGYYGRTTDPLNPLEEQILTPGFVVAHSFQQMLGSGFRQLENASEIDQIVSALWGGLTTQLLTDTRGLSGLARAQSGLPSYIDRMTAEASAGIREGAVNAAIEILRNSRQIESAFRQAKAGTAQILTTAIERLREAERRCWELIIPAVESYAKQSVCTGPADPQTGEPTNCAPPSPPVKLEIATSTVESQRVINSQIAPIATSTARDLDASERALALIDELIASVTNTTSQTAQRAALERLDTMVATGQLHTAAEANAAIKQQEDVNNAAAVLVEDTLKAWGDSPDPNVGWCNVNNESVIQRWFNAWRVQNTS